MRTGMPAELPREPMVRAAIGPTGWLAARSARPNWFPLPLLPALDAVGFSAALSVMLWGLLLSVSLASTAVLLAAAILRGRTPSAKWPNLSAHEPQRNGSATSHRTQRKLATARD
jgi:hypothetical protein